MDKILALISYGLGLYVGIWNLLVKSIINACNMFDAGTLTGSDIGWTIFKCLMSFPVTYVVTLIAAFIIVLIREFIRACSK